MNEYQEYNPDIHATTLEEGNYLCRLEYPDGQIRYRIKRFNIYGVGTKRGYFTSNGKKFKVTHFMRFPKLEK